MLAEEAKACFSPWSTCWLHSSLEFEKSLDVALFEFQTAELSFAEKISHCQHRP